MSSKHQLRLALWKDYLLRIRHPVLLSTVYLCAFIIFLIAFFVRMNMVTYDVPTCQFSPRAMPSAGLLPFIQTFICNINNECQGYGENDELPSFENTKVGSLVAELKPLLMNDSFLSVVKSLPNSVKLITTVADILNSPEIKKLVSDGIPLRELIRDKRGLKKYLTEDLKLFDSSTFEAMMHSNINVPKIITSINDKDESNICDSVKLGAFLIIEDKQKLKDISESLCSLNEEEVRQLIGNIITYLDFGSVLRMVGRAMDHLGHYDVLSDIANMIDAVLRLQKFQAYIPANFSSLSDVIPQVLPLFKTFNTTSIDFGFIQAVIDAIDPSMKSLEQWAPIKRFASHITTLLQWIQDKMLRRKSTQQINSAELYKNLKMDLFILQHGPAFKANNNNTNSTDLIPQNTMEEIMGTSWKLMNHTALIIDNILANTTEPWVLAANILDEIKLVFPFIGFLKTKTIMLNNIIRVVNELLTFNIDGQEILYDVAQKHNTAIDSLVVLGPDILNDLLTAFYDQDKVNIILKYAREPRQLFCDKEKLRLLFLVDRSKIRDLQKQLCTKHWANFVENLVKETGYSNIELALDNLNSNQTMDFDYYGNRKSDSFGTLFRNLYRIYKRLLKYLKHENATKVYNWQKINTNFGKKEWMDVITKAANNKDLKFSTVRLKIIQNAIAQSNLPKNTTNYAVDLIELILDDMNQKLQLLFLTNDEVNLLTKESNDIINEQNIETFSDLNWRNLIKQHQDISEILHYLFTTKFHNLNWTNFSQVQTELEKFWDKRMDFGTGLQLSAQSFAKLFEILDLNEIGLSRSLQWNRVKAFAFTVNKFLNYAHQIFDVAVEYKAVNLSDLIQQLPETERVASLLLVNMPVLLHDFGSSVTYMEPNETMINTFMTQEPPWPCSKLGFSELFGLRNKSAEVITEIERMTYENNLISEWQNKTVIQQIINAWKGDEPSKVRPQWRNSIQIFRSLINKINTIKDTDIELFADLPEFDQVKIVNTWKAMIEDFNKEYPKMQIERKIIQLVDKFITYAKQPKDSFSDIIFTYDTCVDDKKDNCEVLLKDLPLYLFKYIPEALSRIVAVLDNYFIEIQGNDTNAFQVIGFTKETGPYNFNAKFPELILVFLHSFQQNDFQKLFTEKSEGSLCKKIFKNVQIPPNNTVTRRDLQQLSDYLCFDFFHFAVMEENVFLKTSQIPQNVYYEPISSYKKTYEQLLDDILKVKKNAENLTRDRLTIKEKVWTEDWKHRMKDTARTALSTNFTVNTTAMNILHHFYGNETWFQYLIAFMDSAEKFSSSIKSNLKSPREKGSQLEISSIKVLGYGFQTFLLTELVLKKSCNESLQSKLDTNPLKVIKYQCPFDNVGIENDLNAYFKNETIRQTKFTVIETTLQNIVNNIQYFSNTSRNFSSELANMEIWQNLVQDVMPSDDKETSRKWAKYLISTYKKRKVSKELLLSLDSNLNAYTAVLNGFKGEMSFRSPQEQAKKIGYNERLLENHIVEFQSALRYVLKNPKLLSISNKSEIEENFNSYNNPDKGIELVQMITEQLNYFLDLTVYWKRDETECEWCSVPTILIREVTKQVSQFRRYSNLLCQLQYLTFQEFYKTLLDEYGWREIPKKFSGDVKYNYKQFTEELRSFLATISVQVTLAQSTGDLNKTQACLADLKDSPAIQSIKLYYQLFSDMIKFVGSSSGHINEILALEKKIAPLLNFLEDKLEVLQQTNVVLLDVPSYRQQLKKQNYSEYEIDRIVATDININRLLRFNLTNKMHHLFNKSYYQNMIIDEKSSAKNYSFEIVLYNNTNWPLINQKISEWRHDSIWSFEWLPGLMENIVEILKHGGQIMEIGDQLSLRNLTSKKPNVVGVLDGVLQLIQKSTLDQLASSINGLIWDLKPLTRNSEIEDDLEAILKGVESLNAFRENGLIKMEYNVSSLFRDWDIIKDFLVTNLSMPTQTTSVLKRSAIDFKPLLTEETSLIHLQDYICDANKISKVIKLDTNNTELMDSVRNSMCTMDLDQTGQLTKLLASQLNFEELFGTLINTTIDNVLVKANLTPEEGKAVFDDLKQAVSLVPSLKLKFQNISLLFGDSSEAEALKAEDSQPEESSPEFLSQASTLMCGKPLVQSSSRYLMEIAAQTHGTLDDLVNLELKSLPTEFCRNMYTNIITMDAGQIIWTYIKPLIRGQILYTPQTDITRKIIRAANTTFSEIASLGDILNYLSGGVTSLSDLAKKNNSLNNLQKILKSPVMQMALTSFDTGSIDLDNLDLEEISSQFQGSQKMASMVNLTAELMKCIITDRFVGVNSEEDLEETAKTLLSRNEFIAGIVFTNNDTELNKYDTSILPKHLKYKIRMDVDNVPSTLRSKSQFWVAGPESDFLEDLRYFRGFVQLQDMIDQAIVKLQSKDVSDLLPEIYTQQFPYPCYRSDSFIVALHASQGLPASFFFGLMMLVASVVRYKVWERETQNSTLMHVMGLQSWINFTSWFIVSFIEMMLTMTLIMIIIILGNILPHANLFIVYLFFLNFGFSVIMFCYMLSTFCKVASAAAITTVIVYYISYMPYTIVISMEAVLPYWQKLLINLVMCSSFGSGCVYLMRFEVQGVGLDWNNFWDSPIQNDPMSFGVAFVFLTIDAILYGFIGYCVSRIVRDTPVIQNSLEAFKTSVGSTVHPNVGVYLENVTKVYKMSKNNIKTAVDNINLQLYNGQITTLLGHNGAGKTTLINMLTGMSVPTSGKIVINDIRYSNTRITRQYLGVCPQSCILLTPLSAREHLMFYAQLKTSLSAKYVQDDVNNMLESLGLGIFENEPVSNLSEGTKRRISVAIAFIGEPTLVVLDEPSSGVDPVARRQIWDLIINHKKDRTVLLTTHHFDEAELLSDRIVVLHKGQVHCSGTPLSLKHNYGKGYHLEVIYPEKSNTKMVDVKTSNLLLNAIRDAIGNANVTEIVDNRIMLELPFLSTTGQANSFEKVALILEQQKYTLGFEHFTFNCTTLENIFLDICAEADAVEKDKTSTMGSTNHPINNVSLENIYNTHVTNSNRAETKENLHLFYPEDPLTSRWQDQLGPLFYKRLVHFMLDRKVLICAFALPTIIIAIAMALTLAKPPTFDDPPLELDPNIYDPHPVSFLSYNDQNGISLVGENLLRSMNDHNSPLNILRHNDTDRNCKCVEGGQICTVNGPPLVGEFTLFYSEKEASKWLVETDDQYIEKRYGGWSIKTTNNEERSNRLTVWYNNKGHHAMPAYSNKLTNAILHSTCADCNITTYSHPLQLSREQLSRRTVMQHLADVGVVLVILVAMNLVPSSVVIYLVQERVNEEKRLQMLSGVTPKIYWAVSFLWDMMVYVIATLLAVMVFEIFQLTAYVSRENLYANIVIMLLYGWALIPTMYLAEKLFMDSSLAFMGVYGMNSVLGIVPMVCIFLIEILSRSEFADNIRHVLEKLFLILPQYTFSDAMLMITKNNIQSELLRRFDLDTYQSPFGWDLMGGHYLVLLFFGAVAFIANIWVENNFKFKSKKLAVSTKGKYLLETVALGKEFNSFDGIKVAVDSLSLKVPPGQCLGLLGVNGAGKSTTFRMLTTELVPTSGKILIENQDIGEGPLCTGQLGYCPQTNAMDPKLTTVQCLRFYAQLKGISKIEAVIKRALDQFDLAQYANQRFENLSGGNKRKLCAAVSVLGKAPIILMDEPTSGMDPAARELVAAAIDQITKQNRSVILTSHSMEECETLCSQVVILIKGRIKCSGPPQSLKTSFGGGYIVSVRLRNENQQSELNNLMASSFPMSRVESQQYCSSQFLIPTENMLTSEIFHKMIQICTILGIVDYSIVQSSLDQVFINLAHSTEEADNNVNEQGQESVNLNMFALNKSSMDYSL